MGFDQEKWGVKATRILTKLQTRGCELSNAIEPRKNHFTEEHWDWEIASNSRDMLYLYNHFATIPGSLLLLESMVDGDEVTSGTIGWGCLIMGPECISDGISRSQINTNKSDHVFQQKEHRFSQRCRCPIGVP